MLRNCTAEAYAAEQEPDGAARRVQPRHAAGAPAETGIAYDEREQGTLSSSAPKSCSLAQRRTSPCLQSSAFLTSCSRRRGLHRRRAVKNHDSRYEPERRTVVPTGVRRPPGVGSCSGHGDPARAGGWRAGGHGRAGPDQSDQSRTESDQRRDPPAPRQQGPRNKPAEAVAAGTTKARAPCDAPEREARRTGVRPLRSAPASMAGSDVEAS